MSRSPHRHRPAPQPRGAVPPDREAPRRRATSIDALESGGKHLTGGTPGVLISVASLLFGGCATSSSSLSYTPYTGIEIPSSILSPRGCGTASGQVYKYVVVLSSPSERRPHEEPGDIGARPQLGTLSDGGPAAYASAFSCYTEGAFASISAAPNGDPNVGLWIYAFDDSTFLRAAAAVPALACDRSDAGIVATCALKLADVEVILNGPMSYTAKCIAIPESGDHVLASCTPLEPPAGVDGSAEAGDDSSADGDGANGANGADAAHDSEANGGDGGTSGDAAGAPLE